MQLWEVKHTSMEARLIIYQCQKCHFFFFSSTQMLYTRVPQLSISPCRWWQFSLRIMYSIYSLIDVLGEYIGVIRTVFAWEYWKVNKIYIFNHCLTQRFGVGFITFQTLINISACYTQLKLFSLADTLWRISTDKLIFNKAWKKRLPAW